MISGRCKFLRDWKEWDSHVHSDEQQINRQGRAMSYPFTFEVNCDAETAVFSSTSDLPFYNTDLSRCDCYDFQSRGLPCKHMYRLAVELCYVEIINRPTLDKERLQQVKDSDNIDSQPEQIKRIEKARDAKCAPLSIDTGTKTAVFSGSGKKPYETTVDSCTCRDYFVRRLPCKHIYRLRMELGLFDEN